MFCTSCGTLLQQSFKFCPECGGRVQVIDVGLERPEAESEKEIIESYFFSGYEYETILHFLCEYHGFNISLSTLKRRLKEFNLSRRSANDIEKKDLLAIIVSELDGPSCVTGYRTLWHTLRMKYGLCIPRNRVQQLLKEVDPNGAEERKSRRLKRRKYYSAGPNQCWHVDGYDKLKPFGFPIHGAVDGYSRRVLWLQVAKTNSDPAVTASYFHKCVDELGGCPVLLRTDPGTENGVMAGMQCYLREDGTDTHAGEKAHRYGASTGNQRIECWWSHLKRSRTCWWINFFKELFESGSLDDGNIYHKECLWFCFHEILQQDLDFVKLHWNTHRIRPSRHDTVAGKPDELFFLPERSGGTDQLHPVSQEKTNELESRCHKTTAQNDHQDYLQYVVDTTGLSKPTNWRHALSLLNHLMIYAD